MFLFLLFNILLAICDSQTICIELQHACSALIDCDQRNAVLFALPMCDANSRIALVDELAALHVVLSCNASAAGAHPTTMVKARKLICGTKMSKEDGVGPLMPPVTSRATLPLTNIAVRNSETPRVGLQSNAAFIAKNRRYLKASLSKAHSYSVDKKPRVALSQPSVNAASPLLPMGCHASYNESSLISQVLLYPLR